MPSTFRYVNSFSNIVSWTIICCFQVIYALSLSSLKNMMYVIHDSTYNNLCNWFRKPPSETTINTTTTPSHSSQFDSYKTCFPVQQVLVHLNSHYILVLRPTHKKTNHLPQSLYRLSFVEIIHLCMIKTLHPVATLKMAPNHDNMY